MGNIQIRQATLSDINALQSISKRTFFETFAEVNSAENMAKYLAESLSVEKLTAELNHPGATFYFAESGETVVGYLKLNFGEAQTELKDSKALEIERIYVIQEFHGRQVGQLLYEKAMDVALQAGAAYIWLGVWEENKRAINFYQKNGFEAFDTHIFRLGDDEQTDIMMKLNLI